MKKSEKRALLNLLLEEDGGKDNLTIESVIEKVKQSGNILVKKYEDSITFAEKKSMSDITKNAIEILKWIKNIIKFISEDNDLLSSQNIESFKNSVYKSIKEAALKASSKLGNPLKTEVVEKSVKYFLSKYTVTLDPEKDFKIFEDVVNYINNNISENKENENIHESTRGFIMYLSHNTEFINKFAQQYLKVVAQIAASSLFDKVKELFKSPKKALDKIKEFVEDIKQKVQNSSVGQKVSKYLPSSTGGKLILGVAIIVLLLIAIKKFPIIGRFFGKVWKLLVMPFNKIISFFRKTPELLEAYLTDPVARKLIETKMRRMDMYAALYLSA